MHDPVFPNGMQVCEVDPDVGRAINPLIVHGQTHGAIVQGIGQALWESFHVDPDSGQPFTGSLMDYAARRRRRSPANFRGAVADHPARH